MTSGCGKLFFWGIFVIGPIISGCAFIYKMTIQGFSARDMLVATVAFLIGISMFNMMKFPAMSKADPDIYQVMQIGSPLQSVPPKRGRGQTVIGYKRLTMVRGMPISQTAYENNLGKKSFWENWQLEADEVPTFENTNGIYIVHDHRDPELRAYENGETILVEVEGRGQKVIHQTGSRVQFAKITRIVDVEEGVRFLDGSSVREYYKKAGLI